MRSVRLRILASLLVVAVAAIGGWQLLPAQLDENRTITVGTTDTVTSLDPVAPTTQAPGPCSAVCSSLC